MGLKGSSDTSTSEMFTSKNRFPNNIRLEAIQLLLVTKGKEKKKLYIKKKEEHGLPWGQAFKTVIETTGVFMFLNGPLPSRL